MHVHRELAKLPDLLSASWEAHSPLALLPAVPAILGLLRPASLEQVHGMFEHAPLACMHMCIRLTASLAQVLRRPPAGAAAPAELCVLLRGKMHQEADVIVDVERLASTGGGGAAGGEAGGGGRNGEAGGGEGEAGGGEGEAAGGGEGEQAGGEEQLLSVSVSIPARGTKLRQVAALLAEL